MKARSLSLALSLLLAGSAHAAVVLETSSEALRVDPAAAPKVEHWHSGTKAAAVAPLLQLPALAGERAAAVKRRNETNGYRRTQIGISRSIASEAIDDLPQPQLHYVDGGAVLRLDVASPGAAALRVGLRGKDWPDGVELRVAGADGAIHATDAAAARSQADGDGVFWTAVTEGERQQLELFVPAGIDPASVALRVDSLSHLLVSPLTVVGHSKALGDSGSCNVDVVCRYGTLGQPFVSIKNAVARMVFQSGGGTYTCTGTLLNDTDSSTQTPWFFTAHHCIGNQSEASSLTTFWNYETPTCGVDQAGPNTQLTGGSQLVYSQGTTDGALLKLNSTPPAGAILAGWDASALTPGTAITAIHHPSGDIKKVSKGNSSGSRENVSFGDGQTVNSTWKASWSEGTTEGGSSGSGLFTFNGGYQLRGGLFGGGGACSNSGQSEASGNLDFYSRLDQIFPAIQQYLAPAATGPGPTRDYTGQWDVRTEGGRGISMFQFGNTLFAVWFVYDNQGRAFWYQLDPQWTANDVAGGRVVKFTGSPWGPTYNPDARVLTQVGTFTMTFTSGTQANFSYNVDGVNRSVLLQKY